MEKEKLWDDFCEAQSVCEESVPLFETNGSEVRLTQYRKKNPVPVLTRSSEMERLIRRESGKITEDYETHGDRYGGGDLHDASN